LLRIRRGHRTQELSSMMIGCQGDQVNCVELDWRHRSRQPPALASSYSTGTESRLRLSKRSTSRSSRARMCRTQPRRNLLRTQEVINAVMLQSGLRPKDLSALGITNQRETIILWNRSTGEPVYNALVWQHTRVEDAVAKFSRDAATIASGKSLDFRSRRTLVA